MSVNKIGIGTRVGRLTVAEATSERKGGYTVWKCRCDCGGEICLDTRCLQRETVRDCGCESRVAPGQKDVTGKRFGLLTAERPVGVDRKMGSVIWHCRCDCGGEVDAPLHQLTAGYRVSCGCKSRPPLKDWVGKRGKWVAEIRFKGQYHYLDSYADKREAIRARQRGEQMHIDFIQQYYEERVGDEESETVGAGEPVAVGI